MKGISFTGYIPVRFFAWHPKTGKFVPVLKEEIKNDEFVSFYKSIDKDYSRVKAASQIIQFKSYLHTVLL